MAQAPRKGFLPYPEDSVTPEPDLWNIFLQDLEGAPQRLLDLFVGQPLGAMQSMGEALTNPDTSLVLLDDGTLVPGFVDQQAEATANFLTDVGAPTAALGMAASGGPDPNLVNIFAGVRSKTAPRDELNEAAALWTEFTKDGAKLTPEGADKIFQRTGWFPGSDGKWRYEIPDLVRARAGMVNPDELWPSPGEMADIVTASKAAGMEPSSMLPIKTREGTLGQFIDHPELFEAYPDLANIKTRVTGNPLHTQEGVNYLSPSEEIGGNQIEAIGSTKSDLMSVLLHEIQHSVQQAEGFANGGNEEMMRHWLANFPAAEQVDMPSPYQLYRALMGEVEAKQVQERFELGWESGTDPRMDELGFPKFSPAKYTGDTFGPEIPRELQLNPMWFQHWENVPGATGFVDANSKIAARANNFKQFLDQQAMLGKTALK